LNISKYVSKISSYNPSLVKPQTWEAFCCKIGYWSGTNSVETRVQCGKVYFVLGSERTSGNARFIRFVFLIHSSNKICWV